MQSTALRLPDILSSTCLGRKTCHCTYYHGGSIFSSLASLWLSNKKSQGLPGCNILFKSVKLWMKYYFPKDKGVTLFSFPDTSQKTKNENAHKKWKVKTNRNHWKQFIYFKRWVQNLRFLAKSALHKSDDKAFKKISKQEQTLTCTWYPDVHGNCRDINYQSNYKEKESIWPTACRISNDGS